jgi:hypothetical protein
MTVSRLNKCTKIEDETLPLHFFKEYWYQLNIMVVCLLVFKLRFQNCYLLKIFKFRILHSPSLCLKSTYTLLEIIFIQTQIRYNK